MEVFLNVAESLEDVLESALVRLDIQYNELKERWRAFAHYENEKVYVITKEGAFFER